MFVEVDIRMVRVTVYGHWANTVIACRPYHLR